MVARVRYIEDTRRTVYRHTKRPAKHRRAANAVDITTRNATNAAAAGQRRHRARGGDDGADEVVVGVGDEHNARSVDGDAQRVGKLRRASNAVGATAVVNFTSQRRHRAGGNDHSANEAVKSICDVEFPCAVSSNTGRVIKSCRTADSVRPAACRAARAAAASQRRHHACSDDNGADEVVAIIGDVNHPHSIDGDASWIR